MKKKVLLAGLDPVGRWTGNAFLFEDGLKLGERHQNARPIVKHPSQMHIITQYEVDD